MVLSVSREQRLESRPFQIQDPVPAAFLSRPFVAQKFEFGKVDQLIKNGEPIPSRRSISYDDITASFFFCRFFHSS